MSVCLCVRGCCGGVDDGWCVVCERGLWDDGCVFEKKRNCVVSSVLIDLLCVFGEVVFAFRRFVVGVLLLMMV